MSDSNGTAVAVRNETFVQPVDFGGLLDLCKALVPTGFLPEHIKTPGQAAAIIMAGRELGMEPMLALRSISMVKGKIVVAADAQLALFKKSGGRATFKTLTDTEATLLLVHPNGDEHTETFSQADAKKAGLDRPSRNGEPSMYSKFPKAMLRSRVITAGLKSVGFEPTAGGVYDPEEASHFLTNSDSGTAAQSETTSGAVDAQRTPNPKVTAETPLNFGKHKGALLKDLPDGYLEWMVEEGRNLGPNTMEWQIFADHELNARAAAEQDMAAEDVQQTREQATA